MFEVFFLPSKLAKEEEIKFSYIELILSTSYILGNQFSHLSSDSDLLSYSATSFPIFPPFALFLFLPLFLKVAKKVLLRCRMADI